MDAIPQAGQDAAARAAFRRHLWRELSQRLHGAPGRPPPRVLDLGCGDGLGAALLAQYGFAVEGADIEPARVAAAARAHPDLTFTVGDAQDLPQAADTFDAVTAFDVIQDLPDWWRVMAEAVRVAKPGGAVVIETERAWPWWAWGPAALRGLARGQGWQATWALARRHALAAELPLGEAPRRFARRDLVACAARLPVRQVTVHAPCRTWREPEPMWAVMLEKRPASAPAAPLQVADCAYCRTRGLRAAQVRRVTD